MAGGAPLDRRDFLRWTGASLAALPLTGCTAGSGPSARGPAQHVPAEAAASGPPPAPTRMPVLFTAHGSPMNAVQDNAFTAFLEGWAATLPRPRAILCLSAHFEDMSPVVTAAAQPEMIYDYYNFPDHMYELRYPAPGAPAVARAAATALETAGLIPVLDEARGFDHGCWAPLMRIWPAADIPVVQCSIYISEEHRATRELGRALAPLRDQGVMIVGSGNVTHNGGVWTDPADGTVVEDWGRRFDTWTRARLDAWDLDALCDFETASPYGTHAHPTTDHFEPLIACCGAADATGRPRITHAYEGFQGRNISMRCVVME